MSRIIDRRLNGRHKSAVNRQRFLARFKKQIKKAVDEAIHRRSITDLDSGETVSIPSKDIREPSMGFGKGGHHEHVFPGNKEFVKGDRLPRPSGGTASQGGKASNHGDGVDDFVFHISRNEFLDIYFDDLALPDLVKKQIGQMSSFKTVRSGYTLQGIPSNINIVRSFKNAFGRRIGVSSSFKKRLKICEAQLIKLKSYTDDDNEETLSLRQEIEFLKNKIKSIPFIDTFDIRYNHRRKDQMPTTQAVMFCIMDVSGSMDKVKKDLAKKFFLLLYLFLQRNYEKIDVIFIRHHTSAKEVDEEEFFYSRETGGTVVSSSLQLMKKIIKERYDPTIWNIYAAQASDGDNWNADSPYCHELLVNEIMPKVQYFAYIEIMPRIHQSLWDGYLKVKENFNYFAMQTINDASDIYPVFRELFKRQRV